MLEDMTTAHGVETVRKLGISVSLVARWAQVSHPFAAAYFRGKKTADSVQRARMNRVIHAISVLHDAVQRCAVESDNDMHVRAKMLNKLTGTEKST